MVSEESGEKTIKSSSFWVACHISPGVTLFCPRTSRAGEGSSSKMLLSGVEAQLDMGEGAGRRSGHCKRIVLWSFLETRSILLIVTSQRYWSASGSQQK